MVRVGFAVPGIYSLDGSGTGPGAIVHNESGRLVTVDDPARPDEIVAVYATGVGPLEMNIPPGTPGPSPPMRMQRLPGAAIGGRRAEVRWAGLAPGLVGVWQVNLRVPQGLAAGPQELHICTACSYQSLEIFNPNTHSNKVTIAIAPSN